MKIAMWSGPRNLSTALMYSFAQRADFTVSDEPFYAAYLARTGLAHPMHDDILAAQPHDPGVVAEWLAGPIPGGTAHWYQKHMTQHMVGGVPRGWMSGVRNVFLIRHPARVVASFGKGYEAMTLTDIGFLQQVDLFDSVQLEGQTPVVVDSADIRIDPEGMLRRLCDALDLSWDPAMLRWKAGPKPYDGVWAPHWYGSVHASTGFAGPEGPLPELTGEAAAIAEAALPAYARMKAAALTQSE